ncbi:hypothetical protein BFJ70_g16050 [Fusarium oxysporum]|nr:hypothetical protein BFJ70_g16050 [Fusarium oxysporum]
MASFFHPKIGPVQGRDVEGCAQFLGIKYATLRDRFAPAEIIQYQGSGLRATQYGPQVINPPDAVDVELSLIQKSLPKPQFPGVSDVDGLTLNITVPSNADKINEELRLPVLVFIHGGGYSIGGNWWPQYDFSKLVKLSANLGKPIIGININYRVGAPGFLTTPELRAAGYELNNGLRDQRAALRWIEANIAGFGGSPENISVMGESAGGVSAGYLLFSEAPLAKRLICLGGCYPLLGQLRVEDADKVGKTVMDHLGLRDAPSFEMARRLLDQPLEDFWMKIPPDIPMLPIIDGVIIPQQINFEALAQDATRIPGKQWIDGVMIGDSELDGTIMAYLYLLRRKEGIGAAFRQSAMESLHDYPEVLLLLLNHYSLSEAATGELSDDEALLNILRFISDVAFLLPAINFAERMPRSTQSYVYHFNEPNPWSGPFKGYASHILDVAFIFQNYNKDLDEKQKATAVAFASDIITFVNGQQPWKPFNSRRGVKSYLRGGGEYSEPPNESKTRRSQFILELAKDNNGPGMDGLTKVFTNFMEGN